MLPQALAVIQGKGGVGKTSTVAALAGLMAAAKWRVLTVDVDPQGNLGRDLGYYDAVDKAGDGGKGLLGAIQGYPLNPIRGVREGLDCVSAGEATEELIALLQSREFRQPGAALTAINDALVPVADQYDLIVIDCPPGNQLLQKAALGAAQYVLIPTRADEASIDGLLRVDALFPSARTVNPGLHLLGAFLFGVGTQSKNLAKTARTALAECLHGEEHVLTTQIRHAEGAALDARRMGLLAHELEAQLPEARKQHFAKLRARSNADRGGAVDVKGAHRLDGPELRISTSAAGLAADYEALAKEVTGRMAAHRASVGAGV